MLIDRFLPEYHVVSRHQQLIQAPLGQVYDALFQVNLLDSWPIKILFALRGLPSLFRRGARQRQPVSLRYITGTGFIMLGEQPPTEILLGLVGQFWRPTGGLQHLDRDGFCAFAAPGFAKGVWHFALTEQDGGTLVTTETRVYCTDAASLKRFRAYWALIGPFSGLIRREVLRLLRRVGTYSI